VLSEQSGHLMGWTEQICFVGARACSIVTCLLGPSPSLDLSSISFVHCSTKFARSSSLEPLLSPPNPGLLV
jgi:hypothetical protein